MVGAFCVLFDAGEVLIDVDVEDALGDLGLFALFVGELIYLIRRK